MDVPAELRGLRQWCLWRNESGRKVPYQPNHRHARTNDPRTWASLEECMAVINEFTGLGFVFSGDDPYAGIDFDNVWNNGFVSEWANPLLQSLAAGYQEISPSGNGVKIWVRARVPDGKGRKLVVVQGTKEAVEVYDRGRYFTFTGHALTDPSQPIGDCQAAVDAILARFWPAPASTVVVPAPAVFTPPFPAGSGSGSISVLERAARYLDRVPAAHSGQERGTRTLQVAAILVRGFCLTPDQALPLITVWNSRCTPNTWPPDQIERELRRKLADAEKGTGERGWLLRDDRPTDVPGVDLTQFLANFGGTASAHAATAPVEAAAQVDGAASVAPVTSLDLRDGPPPEVPACPIKFPAWCLNPPGLISQVIEHNLATAKFPQPELALAGAIALMSVLTGRKIQDVDGSRTNVYVLGLGNSGCGKDYARVLNKKILLAAGCEEMIGPESWASSAGLREYASHEPAALYQVDEIADLLETMQDPRRAPHLYRIAGELMKLDSSSGTIYKGDAYAERKKNTTIDQPHVVVYGTAVPKKFWGVLTEDNVSEGLLGRMYVFETSDRYVKMVDQSPTTELPASLMEGVLWWVDKPYGEGNMAKLHPTPAVVPYSQDARARYEAHARGIYDRIKSEDDTRAALWQRTVGKTAKLALLFACSRCTLQKDIVIEKEDVDRSIAINNWLTRRMIWQAFRHVASSPYEQLVKRLKRILEKPMTKTDISRKAQWIKRRERDEILDDLVSNGLVKMWCVDTGGKTPQTWFQTVGSEAVSA